MTATILIAAVILTGFAVFALCFNIIFRKNGQFPDTEISHNKELRKMGIICAKEEELRLWGKKNGKKADGSCTPDGCGDCHACSIGNIEKN
ncbi:hypothetical protein B5F83_07485 [Muribaculum sp. An289]|uniref:Uncharacterized protein n=1 Tax=Candidatus Merdivivens faecigallinarum TaxID=2840871 RepID=A0A9D9IY71_9BACT|nr:MULTISPECIES: hypothetical protein [unclassified Muribaculum]MBO8481282.1 hypothetical protein [Candidatus Merdivivens faecigallinarum]OUO36629.1 hypothetical protein B5F83_07485 [Muribaculum sp. An289]OUO42410.1 hypothetical protein B5F81_07770 [Muribaculum sp. An287]